MSDEMLTGDRVGLAGGSAIVTIVVTRVLGFIKERLAESAKARADRELNEKLERIAVGMEGIRAEFRAKAEADASWRATMEANRAQDRERIEGVSRSHGMAIGSLQRETLQRLARLEQQAGLPQWHSTPSGVMREE